jgi:hypothetical protein
VKKLELLALLIVVAAGEGSLSFAVGGMHGAGHVGAFQRNDGMHGAGRVGAFQRNDGMHGAGHDGAFQRNNGMHQFRGHPGFPVHRHFHHRAFVIIGAPFWPPIYDYSPAPVYVEPQPYDWYCPDPSGYYPDIQHCRTRWLRVVPEEDD